MHEQRIATEAMRTSMFCITGVRFGFYRHHVSQLYLSINQYYFIVRPKVDHRVGQLCLPHTEITKTEKNRTKT